MINIRLKMKLRDPNRTKFCVYESLCCDITRKIDKYVVLQKYKSARRLENKHFLFYSLRTSAVNFCLTSMSSDEKDDCSICLNNLGSGSSFLTLSCNHRFHLLCLASNIQSLNKTCPLCRVTIDPSIVQLLSGVGQSSIGNQFPPHISQPIGPILTVNVS